MSVLWSRATTNALLTIATFVWSDWFESETTRVAAAFDDLRRSTAIQRLAAMISLGAVNGVELAQFTPATRASATALAEIFAPTGKASKNSRCT